jgi:hypothetical protein
MLVYRRHSPRVLAPLFSAILILIAIAASFTWYRMIDELRSAQPVGSQARPTAVAWGGLVFSDHEHLVAWLGSRGISYPDWAARHPHAAAIVDPAYISPPAAPKPSADKTADARSAGNTRGSTQAVTKAPTTSASTQQHSGLTWALVLSFVLLTLAALLPRRIWIRLCGRAPRRDQRLVTLGVVAALGVGLLTATLLP